MDVLTDDAITKDYFLDIWENDDSFETDNKAEAMAVFYACRFGCFLWYKGKLIADKEFVDDPIEDQVILVAELNETPKEMEFVTL